MLESAGLREPVGSVCEVHMSGQPPVQAEVVGFSGDRTYLMPTGNVHGLASGARVVPKASPTVPLLLGAARHPWRRSLDRTLHLPVGDGLLGRVIDMKALGENTIVLDCDVLQADGGTRTAAITGAWVALADAVADAKARGLIKPDAAPLTGSVAAVSVGVVGGIPVIDLDYPEDSTAETDMNVVMTGDGRFVEVQGTAEGEPFDRALLGQLLDLATKGCADLTAAQHAALAADPRSRA